MEIGSDEGYDDISGCSYSIIVLPLEYHTDQIPNSTISLDVTYKFIGSSTAPDHDQISSFLLNRGPNAGQIPGLDNITTWLNDSPGFPSVVGAATADVITRALCESPMTSLVLVAVKVWTEEVSRRARGRAAMERIERVVVEETREESCVVCMEEFRVGCDAARLPCDHVFHGGCIEKWFDKQTNCPLCRFELGVDEFVVAIPVQSMWVD